MEKGRVAVVSGGSAGIGRAIAEALAAQGCAVGLGARGVDRLDLAAQAVRRSGARAFSGALDVTNPQSIDDFYAGVESELGPADLLVNCAGHARPASLVQADPEQIRSELETGLLGALLFSRRGLRMMLEREMRGDIVFISSISAVSPWPHLVAYSASKAGVEQAARSLQLELEGTGIRSMIVRVGNTLGTDWSKDWGPDEFARMERWTELGLIRHAGLLHPEQVAATVIDAVGQPHGAHVSEVIVQPTAPPGAK